MVDFLALPINLGTNDIDRIASQQEANWNFRLPRYHDQSLRSFMGIADLCSMRRIILLPTGINRYRVIADHLAPPLQRPSGEFRAKAAGLNDEHFDPQWSNLLAKGIRHAFESKFRG